MLTQNWKKNKKNTRNTFLGIFLVSLLLILLTYMRWRTWITIWNFDGNIRMNSLPEFFSIIDDCQLKYILNPFVPNASFLCPLKTGNRKVFWCFQWLEKRGIGNKWVNLFVQMYLLSISESIKNKGNLLAKFFNIDKKVNRWRLHDCHPNYQACARFVRKIQGYTYA